VIRRSVILENSRLHGRNWTRVVILLAVCALTASLATRFYVSPDPAAHTFKSVEGHSPQPKRQHLDRDASGWVAPGTDLAFMALTAVYAVPTLTQTDLPDPLFSDSLHNRPPPSTDLFL